MDVFNIKCVSKRFYKSLVIKPEKFLIRLINKKLGSRLASRRIGQQIINYISKDNGISIGGSTLVELVKNVIYNGSDIDIFIPYFYEDIDF